MSMSSSCPAFRLASDSSSFVRLISSLCFGIGMSGHPGALKTINTEATSNHHDSTMFNRDPYVNDWIGRLKIVLAVSAVSILVDVTFIPFYLYPLVSVNLLGNGPQPIAVLIALYGSINYLLSIKCSLPRTHFQSGPRQTRAPTASCLPIATATALPFRRDLLEHCKIMNFIQATYTRC